MNTLIISLNQTAQLNGFTFLNGPRFLLVGQSLCCLPGLKKKDGYRFEIQTWFKLILLLDVPGW